MDKGLKGLRSPMKELLDKWEKEGKIIHRTKEEQESMDKEIARINKELRRSNNEIFRWS